MYPPQKNGGLLQPLAGGVLLGFRHRARRVGTPRAVPARCGQIIQRFSTRAHGRYSDTFHRVEGDKKGHPVGAPSFIFGKIPKTQRTNLMEDSAHQQYVSWSLSLDYLYRSQSPIGERCAHRFFHSVLPGSCGLAFCGGAPAPPQNTCSFL